MNIKRNINVFFIEDSEICSLMVDHKLRDISNFKVHSYVSAEEAFKDLYISPDVIVLDYGLPGMNGLQALKKFKQNFPDIPIIMLSGQKNIDVAIDLIRAGASDYMSKKKFSVRELYDKIYTICNQKQQEKQIKRLQLNLIKGLFFCLLIFLLSIMVWLKI